MKQLITPRVLNRTVLPLRNVTLGSRVHISENIISLIADYALPHQSNCWSIV